MFPFLQEVAADLYKKYPHNISDIQVVLPSRRACVYFRYYLSQLIDDVILAPEILSMAEFISQMADTEVTNSVSLLFDLYQNFKKNESKEEQNLEKFAPLGSTILTDFSSIDKNLTQKKAEELFQYLEETKAIERWAEELDKPIELKENSSLTDYLSFWKTLKATYQDFRKQLISEKKAYSGLVYRLVYDNLENIVKELELEQVAFVGFNQLTVVEIDIINRLSQLKKAVTYWDCDSYYMENPQHEAGFYLRKHQNKWLPQIQNSYKNYIQTEAKEIEIISITGQVSQAKWLGAWLQKELGKLKNAAQKEAFGNSVNKIGILLPDENLLSALLHSLPQKMDAQKNITDYINITMGVSMHNTPIFDLFQNIFRMQENLKFEEEKGQQVYYKDLLKILKHPLILFSSEDEQEGIYDVIKSVQRKNIVQYPLRLLKEQLANQEIFKSIFSPWAGSVNKAITSLFQLTEQLSEILKGQENRWEAEYLFRFYKILHNLSELLSEQSEQITIRTFKQFLFDVIKNVSVPFTGEPISPIQIMGMLESRTLDFEQVIILSCNEKILPKGKLVESVIPFDLRLKYGLPTHKENDASYAYTFYRLFHKAKKITLVHSHPLGNSGEKSRFISQVEDEMKDFKNIKITHKNINLESPKNDIFQKEVPKTEAVLDKIKDKFRRGMSPSSIQNFVRNPLEFLHSNIFGLADADEVEESLDARTFGTLLHEMLDKQLQPQIGKNVTKNYLENLITDKNQTSDLLEAIIAVHFGEIETQTGKNYMLKEVAKNLLIKFYKQEQEIPEVGEVCYYLVEQEQFQSHIINISLPNGETIPFRLTGKADRIDIIGNQIRVVDYKTGGYAKKDVTAEERKQLLKQDSKKGKVIQLLLYKYLLIKSLEKGEVANLPKDFNIKEYDVKSGFIFFRKLSDGFVEYQLKDQPEGITAFKQYVEEFIQEIALLILDNKVPFREEHLTLELEE